MTIQETIESLRATEAARSQVFGDNDSSVILVRQMLEAIEQLQKERDEWKQMAYELSCSTSVMVSNWHNSKQTTSRTINLARKRLAKFEKLQ